MNISAYILEYLKQFGTATVPGFGVFSLKNSKAIINSENGSILPPASQIEFAIDYEVQAEDLTAFIAEQKQMSLEASRSDLKIQTDFWKKKLQAEQVLEIQNLGTVFIEEGHTHFKGKRIESGRPDFYGLEEIRFSDINNGEKVNASVNREKDFKFKKTILWIFLLIIPVLAIVYLAFTQQELLFGKKSFNNVSVQTSTHRIVKDTVKVMAHTPETPVSDSLKKDSLVKPAGKVKQSVPAVPNNTKTRWQK
jgi:nucleoid DNA-binding protein